MGRTNVVVPTPSINQVTNYLKKWDSDREIIDKENTIHILFSSLFPENKTIESILAKATILNNFYSTNIFKIYPVAEHILSLDIDDRLKAGDESLVKDIQRVNMGNKERNFYSFASKYCSNHNPSAYPIYDSYVDDVLRYFRRKDNFCKFRNSDLKDYQQFKSIILSFRKFYGLDQYNLKQLDQYLWLLGKEYFPKAY